MSNPFLRAVKEYSLLKKGGGVIAAISGGADSTALLHMLLSVREEYGLTLYAAHFNHMIRGEESDRDEEFCGRLCRGFGIELFVKRADIPALSAELKISEELCGRRARYEFFSELARTLGAEVATAHTLSDRAETLIFNMTRGSSIGGIQSIPAKRDYIIRPLVFCTREYIEEYCEEHKLEYVTDSTNLSDGYTRNRLRHRVIPELKALNPSFEDAADRLIRDAEDVCSYLNAQALREISSAEVAGGYSAERLMSLDRAVRRNALRMICEGSGAEDIESVHIELIEGILRSGGAVCLKGSRKAVVSQGVLRIVGKEPCEICDEEIRLKDLINGTITRFGKKYSFKEVKLDEISDEELSSSVVGVYDENTVFRTRREGDRFTFYERKITKPLRKAMNELKINSETRDKLAVLSVGSTVLWCENIGASACGRADKSSKAVIKIDIEN